MESAKEEHTTTPSPETNTGDEGMFSSFGIPWKVFLPLLLAPLFSIPLGYLFWGGVSRPFFIPTSEITVLGVKFQTYLLLNPGPARAEDIAIGAEFDQDIDRTHTEIRTSLGLTPSTEGQSQNRVSYKPTAGQLLPGRFETITLVMTEQTSQKNSHSLTNETNAATKYWNLPRQIGATCKERQMIIDKNVGEIDLLSYWRDFIWRLLVLFAAFVCISLLLSNLIYQKTNAKRMNKYIKDLLLNASTRRDAKDGLGMLPFDENQLTALIEAAAALKQKRKPKKRPKKKKKNTAPVAPTTAPRTPPEAA